MAVLALRYEWRGVRRHHLRVSLEMCGFLLERDYDVGIAVGCARTRRYHAHGQQGDVCTEAEKPVLENQVQCVVLRPKSRMLSAIPGAEPGGVPML